MPAISVSCYCEGAVLLTALKALALLWLLFLCGEVLGTFPSFPLRLTGTLLSLVQLLVLSLFSSLSILPTSLLPASPGVHQATVRGGAKTVRDLTAAAPA